MRSPGPTTTRRLSASMPDHVEGRPIVTAPAEAEAAPLADREIATDARRGGQALSRPARSTITPSCPDASGRSRLDHAGVICRPATKQMSWLSRLAATARPSCARRDSARVRAFSMSNLSGKRRNADLLAASWRTGNSSGRAPLSTPRCSSGPSAPGFDSRVMAGYERVGPEIAGRSRSRSRNLIRLVACAHTGIGVSPRA